MKKFEVEYKGHHICVENRVTGERLIVDDELQDEQIGFSSRSRLYGRIKGGKGEGETIKVSLGGWITIGCRIFVDDKLIFPA
ncbi:MAG: hypothetical protein P9M15_00045 [Candidatus Electryoneaceae bacterium]|nr:hypothetical protein [Candidatus Electryoneaceae bacterium]